MPGMTLTVDRFEGDDHTIAVLLSDAGWTVDVPRALLKEGLRPGDVVTLDLEKDDEATRAVAEATARVQAELLGRDDGADVSL